MMIEDEKAYIAGLWDWACLNGCFGDSNIRPSDVDGRIERNGRVLEIETKLPGVPIPLGQEIMINNLVDIYHFTELIVWGYPGKPERIEVRTPKGIRVFEDTNLDMFRELVSQWYKWADRAAPPHPG